MSFRTLSTALIAGLLLASGCGVEAITNTDAGPIDAGLTDGGNPVQGFAISLASSTPTRGTVAVFAASSCGNVSSVLINGGTIPTNEDPSWHPCTVAAVTEVGTSGVITSAPLLGGLNQLRVWVRVITGGSSQIYDFPPRITVVRDSMFALGNSHSCALVAGAVKCWGDNSLGQLGTGTTVPSALPVAVPGMESDIIEIASGPQANHTCALKSTGTVFCWGANDSSQLGNPSVTHACNSASSVICTTSPVQVLQADGQPLAGAVQIVAGASHTCALLVNGQTECWGGNNDGQCSIGDTTTVTAPTPTIGFPLGVNQSAVVDLPYTVELAAGVADTCARVAGTLSCAGLDYVSSPTSAIIGGSSDVAGSAGAQCVDSATMLSEAGPGGASGPEQIAIGYEHLCISSSGSGTSGVQCWGDNSVGQYGNGSTTPMADGGASVPLNGVADLIVAGSFHSCARVAGVVWCWGDNDYGQLGGTTTTQCTDSTGTSVACSTSPMPVPLADVAALGAGRKQTCAATDGQIWCWGGNDSGELGGSASDDCASSNGAGNGPPLLCSHAPVNVLGIAD